MASIKWMQQIHAENPYQRFPADKFATDLQGWGQNSPIFEKVISTYRPSLVIEVGTWKGASAIRIAELMKRCRVPEPEVICVDTWLGSVEHWLDRSNPNHFPSLALKWGRPDLYNTFMANVVRAGHDDVIVPFPADTSTAAKFLRCRGMQADLIYIDASHEYENVIADLVAFWEVLRPGGVLIGDDFIAARWPGVVRAVHEFVNRAGQQVNTSFANKYLIEKRSPRRRPSLSARPDRNAAAPAVRNMSVVPEARVINLDRSTDRMRRFTEANAHLGEVPRFPAVDGAKIDRVALEKEGVVSRDLEYGPGTLGCALSHVALWREVLERRRSLTVFEDDAVTAQDFAERAATVMDLLGDEWDFVFWGCTLNPDYAWIDLGVTRTRLHIYGAPRLDGLAAGAAVAPVKLLHASGLYAYSVSPSGAQAALDHCLPLRDRLIPFPDTGIILKDRGIDGPLCGLYPSVRAYVVLPFLATMYDGGSDRIQTDRAAQEMCRSSAMVD